MAVILRNAVYLLLDGVSQWLDACSVGWWTWGMLLWCPSAGILSTHTLPDTEFLHEFYRPELRSLSFARQTLNWAISSAPPKYTSLTIYRLLRFILLKKINKLEYVCVCVGGGNIATELKNFHAPVALKYHWGHPGVVHQCRNRDNELLPSKLFRRNSELG